ncbi:hypothetical protein BC834DRAFT_550126 [Gloeopeniophorella convolvens]|nr:hypothetical protein BC834DRAFT_550126 [Gloeopeniophorella convolvens]
MYCRVCHSEKPIFKYYQLSGPPCIGSSWEVIMYIGNAQVGRGEGSNKAIAEQGCLNDVMQQITSHDGVLWLPRTKDGPGDTTVDAAPRASGSPRKGNNADQGQAFRTSAVAGADDSSSSPQMQLGTSAVQANEAEAGRELLSHGHPDWNRQISDSSAQQPLQVPSVPQSSSTDSLSWKTVRTVSSKHSSVSRGSIFMMRWHAREHAQASSLVPAHDEVSWSREQSKLSGKVPRAAVSAGPSPDKNGWEPAQVVGSPAEEDNGRTRPKGFGGSARSRASSRHSLTHGAGQDVQAQVYEEAAEIPRAKSERTQRESKPARRVWPRLHYLSYVFCCSTYFAADARLRSKTQ